MQLAKGDLRLKTKSQIPKIWMVSGNGFSWLKLSSHNSLQLEAGGPQ